MAFPWLINGGGPNHLLTGMILHVVFHVGRRFRPAFAPSENALCGVPHTNPHKVFGEFWKTRD